MATVSPTVDLAERIRNGERSAEAALVDHFYRRVYAMALVRTKDCETARDLAQEIMLAVLCGLREGRLRNQDGLAGYICGTARNQINHFFRKRKLRSSTESRSPSSPVPIDPEKSFGEAERRRQALYAIERLNSTDRNILRLTLTEGLKPGEIAAQLGLKTELVRKRKSRAVRRARQEIRRKTSRS